MRALGSVLMMAMFIAPPAQAQTAHDARLPELWAADSALGAAAADTFAADALARLFAPHAVLVGRELVTGAEAIAATLRQDSLLQRGRARWRPVRAEVSADGRFGYTWGFLDLTDGAGRARPGKYISVWQREEDGRWLLIAYKRGPRPGDRAPREQPLPEPAPANPRAMNAAAATQELARMDSAFSRAAQHDVRAAFARHTAPDAMTFGSTPEFTLGHADVVEFFAAGEPGSFEWWPRRAAVSSSADLGFTTGLVVFREKGPDGKYAQVAQGHYLTIWKRSADGTWRLVADG